MARKITNTFFLGVVCISLTSCSVFNYFFPSKKLAYQEHEAQVGLEFPEGIHSSRIRDQMPVPELSDSLKQVPLPKELDRPAPLKIGLMSDGVQKRSVGEKQWLVVDRSASQVWPELEKYLVHHGLKLAASDPRIGTMDSSWVEDPNEFVEKLESSDSVESENTVSETAFRVRMMLQPGIQHNTAKVEIKVSTDKAQWPAISDSVELENLVLDDLSVFLGKQLQETSSVSLLAQQMGRNVEVELLADQDENSYLTINQDFNRSWYLVGKAIRELEMPLFDINRSLGLYYLSTGHEESDKFSFARKLKAHKQISKLEGHQDFQIYVLEVADGSEVRVRLNLERSSEKLFNDYVLNAISQKLASYQTL